MSKRAASENHLFGSVQPGGFAVEKLYNVDGWVALGMYLVLFLFALLVMRVNQIYRYLPNAGSARNA